MKQNFTVRHGALDGVEAFLSVAHHRSFRRAAAELGVTPSAISQAIRALEALRRASSVKLTSDSQYVMHGIEKWLPRWQANGWRTSDKKPVKNQDLWERLVAAVSPHCVRWHWTRGHSGHIENEKVDKLAREAALAMAEKD